VSFSTEKFYDTNETLFAQITLFLFARQLYFTGPQNTHGDK